MREISRVPTPVLIGPLESGACTSNRARAGNAVVAPSNIGISCGFVGFTSAEHWLQDQAVETLWHAKMTWPEKALTGAPGEASHGSLPLSSSSSLDAFSIDIRSRFFANLYEFVRADHLPMRTRLALGGGRRPVLWAPAGLVRTLCGKVCAPGRAEGGVDDADAAMKINKLMVCLSEREGGGGREGERERETRGAEASLRKGRARCRAVE